MFRQDRTKQISYLAVDKAKEYNQKMTKGSKVFPGIPLLKLVL